MASRCCYVLFDLYKRGVNEIDYELVEQVEVDLSRSVEVLAEELAGWALDVIGRREARFGLYSAELSTLDEEGQADRHVYNVHICWDDQDQSVVLPNRKGVVTKYVTTP
jgi:hypothetical protein